MTRPRILPLALLPLLALAACGSKTDTEQTVAADDAAAQSSEWVLENPTEPAVPVNLPETPMTSVPVDKASPAPGQAPKPAGTSPPI